MRTCMRKGCTQDHSVELVGGGQRLLLCATDFRTWRTEGDLPTTANPLLDAQLEAGMPPPALVPEDVAAALGAAPEWYAVQANHLVTDAVRVPLALIAKAVWTTEYINNLPDSSFAVISPGGEKDADGKTTPRSLRHLPYKDADGTVDMAHLRNALSRLPQTDLSAEEKARATAKLNAAAKGADVGQPAAKATQPATFAQLHRRRDALAELGLMVDTLDASVRSLVNDEANGPLIRRSIQEFRTAVEPVCEEVGTAGPHQVAAIAQLAKTLEQMLTGDQVLDAVTLCKHAMATGPVRLECGEAFSADAYALVYDAMDPATWRFRMCSAPGGTPDRSQMLAALTEFKRYNALPEAIRTGVVERLSRGWTAAGLPEPLPPLLTHPPDATLVAKPGLDETENSFRYRVRDPGQFVAGSFRTVALTDGVSSVMGKTEAGGPMTIQSIILSKEKFKSKEDAQAWLKAHPDVKKAEDTTNAVVKEAALSWEQDMTLKLPTSGAAQPFVLHAVYRNLPPNRAEADVAQLEAEGYPASYILRFGTGRAPLYYGFACSQSPLGLGTDYAVVTAQPREGSAIWLRKREDQTDEHDKTITKMFTLDAGSYLMEWACPERLVVKLDGSKLSGSYVAAGAGDWWVLRQGTPADAPTAKLYQPIMRAAAATEGKWMLWPKSKRGGGQGQRVIDAAEQVAHQLDYNVVKIEKQATSEGGQKWQQYSLGVAYPANKVDAHGDFATHEQLEKTAWSFNVQRRGVGLMHQDGTDGAGAVVESYIYRGPDWRIGKQVVKAGDWLLGVLWGNGAWKTIKSGGFKGYSIQGWARR